MCFLNYAMCFLNYYANKKYDWNYQTKILICLKQSSSLFDFL